MLAAYLAELLGRHWVRDESLMDALFRVKLEKLLFYVFLDLLPFGKNVLIVLVIQK